MTYRRFIPSVDVLYGRGEDANMREVEDLFSASAASLWDTMISHGGTAGFRIPDYQRTFDWSSEKIGRLIEDCVNNFSYLGRDEESYTFLGTLILVRERSEPHFDGTSLGVVDGQQRLTTLLLMCGCLSELLNVFRPQLADLQSSVRDWLEREVEYQLGQLNSCVTGQLPGRSRRHPYPRIVRSGDYRAKQATDAEYTSLVARVLMAFTLHYESELSKFEFPGIGSSGDNERFFQNYKFISRQLLYLADPDNAEGDIEIEVVDRSDFSRRGFSRLFAKLSVLGDESQQQRALSTVCNAATAGQIVRLLLFASYLLERVVLTRVETVDEDSAFDIFDALNTTGEPLTAIETFRPRVIQYESKRGRYETSDAYAALQDVDEAVSHRYANPDARQREAKEIVVTFALYFDGSKESRELSSQRRYLRTRYEGLATPELRSRFVRSFRDISVFRSKYWVKESIDALSSAQHSREHLEDLKLCFRLFKDMNMSLVLPILARYWSAAVQTGDDKRFADAVKALTAFVVFRRSTTGSTAGIDGVLRRIMAKASSFGDELCLGSDFRNNLLEPSQLKGLLRQLLEGRGVEISDRSDWVRRARDTPVADASKPLARFLVLAASTYAAPDPEWAGLMTRKDVRASSERHYLSYANWASDLYASVEHVAPDSNPGSGWDGEIYSRASTRHTLGNLTLLPQAENSSAGNRGWQWKRVFYRAMAETSTSEQRLCFEEAKKKGFQFSARTEKLLSEGRRLHILDPLRAVDDWNAAFIERRSENMLSLAWDHLRPWLCDDVG